MHDGRRPDIQGLDTEAYSQAGYFTVQQAREHGVSSQLLHHHARRGRYESVRRGLYRLPGFPSAEHDEMREKWMAVGTYKAVLSHESALALLGLGDNIPSAVHLLVPRRHRGLRRPGGVVIHTHSDNETIRTVWRDGLPLTAPARTLVDAVKDLQPEQAAMAVQQALHRGLVTITQLEQEARRQHRSRSIETILAATADR